MKKTVLTVGVILAAAFMFYTIWVGGASHQLGRSWELEMPKGGTEVYCFIDKGGAAYYAFIYDEAEEIKDAFDWEETEGATNEYESYSDAIEAWMEEAKVPVTLPIDIPDGPYYYESKEDGSEIIIVRDKRMLHMIEKVVEPN